MVKVTLYGHPKATCTQRVLILLEELELKYNFEEIDIKGGEQKEKKYLQMQPFGKVPVVNYGSRCLFESRGILRYIAKNNKEQVDLLGDVTSDIWLEVESQNFNPPASAIVHEHHLKGEDANEDEIAKQLAKLEVVLDVYEGHLADKEYIAGATYSIADISHIPYAYALLKFGYKDVLKKRPNVYNWLKRIMRRPAVRSVLEGKLKNHDSSDAEI